MKLAIIGTGYVGLVSGVCFAELGFDVTCIDNNPDKIAQLQARKCPIYEPGLTELMAQNTARLSYTRDLATAVKAADIVMIAVGTPPDPSEEGKADLRYVYAAAEELAAHLDGFTVVITKSTVPPGTNREVARRIAAVNAEAEFAVASNPEFLREGSAIGDFMQPDRIICGTEDARAKALLEQLYAPLTTKGYPLLITGLETAEVIKYAANTFLATKIAFINEMADIAEKVGADIELVAKGMGMDARIGERFLRPGPGFGGSCFPKDAQALARLASASGVYPEITNTVVKYNLARRESMGARVVEACDGSVVGKTIAILGLTFKANTDDMRESAALHIIPFLLNGGAAIRAYDPEGMANAKPLLPDAVTYCENASTAMQGADCVCIVTEWDEFRSLDWVTIKPTLKHLLIVDLRNLFKPEDMANFGYRYHSIGRKAV
ncbi:MAG: UDP-glucose 6-dehydrogenase [Rickettsiales bacterium]|nr:UDP-glucose 6-dehydrogenase [Rickettsiales bacterium]